MNERQQNIVTLEDQAEKLVNNLSSLYNQVGSYKNAKSELETTNNTLIEFIEQTKLLAVESHKIIAELNEIGTSKIFDRLDIIDQKLELNEKDSSIKTTKLENLDEKLNVNKNTNTEINDKLDNAEQKLDLNEKANSMIFERLENINQNLNVNEKKSKLYFVAIIGSASIIIILQIVGLTR